MATFYRFEQAFANTCSKKVGFRSSFKREIGVLQIALEKEREGGTGIESKGN